MRALHFMYLYSAQRSTMRLDVLYVFRNAVDARASLPVCVQQLVEMPCQSIIVSSYMESGCQGNALRSKHTSPLRLSLFSFTAPGEENLPTLRGTGQGNIFLEVVSSLWRIWTMMQMLDWPINEVSGFCTLQPEDLILLRRFAVSASIAALSRYKS